MEKNPYKFNKKNPPIYNALNVEEFEELVDIKSFPKCSGCEQPIFNPTFYPGNNPTGLCGPCCSGEAATIMMHTEESTDKNNCMFGMKLN